MKRQFHKVPKTKQCESSAYTKDRSIGESVRIILLLILVWDILMVHSKLDDMPVEDLNNVMSQ